MAFTYATVAQTVSIFASLFAIVTTDHLGRRPLLHHLSSRSVLFNFLVAGLGFQASKSEADINMIIARLIYSCIQQCYLSSQFVWVFPFVTKLVYPVLMTSEIGWVTRRKKCKCP